MPDDRTLRSPRSAWMVMIFITTFIVGFTVIAFTMELDWWYRVAFVTLTLVCLVAFVELGTQRVVLARNELIMVKNFRRHVFARQRVVAVTWAKGAGVSIRLSGGEWIGLPAVGGNHLSVTNTVRGWINRTLPDRTSPQ